MKERVDLSVECKGRKDERKLLCNLYGWFDLTLHMNTLPQQSKEGPLWKEENNFCAIFLAMATNCQFK